MGSSHQTPPSSRLLYGGTEKFQGISGMGAVFSCLASMALAALGRRFVLIWIRWLKFLAWLLGTSLFLSKLVTIIWDM